MKAEQSFATWVEVDLNALKENLKIIQREAGADLMAVVKANGYGHGFMPVTRAAQEAGVTWFGVARPRMASRMREEGISSRILVLGYIAPERIEEMICLDAALTVWTRQHIELVKNAAARCQRTARIHLLVDTGMGRLGCHPHQALELARFASKQQGLELEGLFSHLARADEPEQPTTAAQQSQFRKVISSLEKAQLLPKVIHLANSAGTLAHPKTRYQLVRPGIIIYGLAPSPEVGLPEGIQPILSWKSVLASLKTLPPGHGVSYGHAYVTGSEELVGVIPVGYADGYRRVPGNEVLINGARAPIIGRVCMDQFMVQLKDVPDPKVGDEVVLIGRQGDLEITADQLARVWDTINYEVTCGIGARVPRIYPD